MSVEENRALVRRIPEEVWSLGDMAAADAVLSEEFVNHNPAFGHESTREGYKATVSAFRAAFPDLVMSVVHALAEGDLVAMRLRVTGTHRGQFGAFAPSGRSIEFTVSASCRVRDGRVVELWVNGDLLGLVGQLGGTVVAPSG